MKKTLSPFAALVVIVMSVCLFAGLSPKQRQADCVITVNGQEVRITGSRDAWVVVCDRAGLEASGETLCEPLQAVIDALPE